MLGDKFFINVTGKMNHLQYLRVIGILSAFLSQHSLWQQNFSLRRMCSKNAFCDDPIPLILSFVGWQVVGLFLKAMLNNRVHEGLTFHFVRVIKKYVGSLIIMCLCIEMRNSSINNRCSIIKINFFLFVFLLDQITVDDNMFPLFRNVVSSSQFVILRLKQK